jgi:hypothetical protein
MSQYEKLGDVCYGSRWSNISGCMVEMRRLEIRCHCGERLVCGEFTNTCDCGRDYNMNGTLLAPRDRWGEETGESVADILAVNHGEF